MRQNHHTALAASVQAASSGASSNLASPSDDGARASALPPGNTGALSTGGAGALPRLSALVDWVTVTLPREPRATVDDFIPGSSSWGWVRLPHGTRWYAEVWACGALQFCCQPRQPEYGVMLAASGDGCRELEARGASTTDGVADKYNSVASFGMEAPRTFDWSGWFAYLLARGAHFTVLHWAFDDRAGLLQLPAIRAAWSSGDVTCRARQAKLIEGYEKGAGKSDGETFEIGDPSSETRCIFYDKAAEQGVKATVPHWVRCEYRVKRERAQLLAAAFVAEGVAAVARNLLWFLDFKRPNSEDSNKSRWETVSWWASFLGRVRKLKLTVAPKVRGVAEVYGWLRGQVAPSIALVVAAGGGNAKAAYRTIKDLCEVGMPRLGPKHYAMLAAG